MTNSWVILNQNTHFVKYYSMASVTVCTSNFISVNSNQLKTAGCAELSEWRIEGVVSVSFCYWSRNFYLSYRLHWLYFDSYLILTLTKFLSNGSSAFNIPNDIKDELSNLLL